MNELILNGQVIRTDRPSGMTLLDFVRYQQHLKGTKIGCREGDCGACTVLVGAPDANGEVRYRSVTSCISPLGNAWGKHVVTVDGLKQDKLSPVQEALVCEGGTQCGFCTPGFAVSLTGYCLSCDKPDLSEAVAAIDGNICRCTGYKSIERSTQRVVNELQKGTDLHSLIKNGFLPPYFLDIPEKLAALKQKKAPANGTIVGGGTDLYVQRPEDLTDQSVNLFSGKKKLSGIKLKQGLCKIGAATTATDLLESEEMNQIFPDLKAHLKLVSSTQIRNMGTIAGNFVNASPIGDLTIFFLALDATITLRGDKKRSLPLREFYQGYKKLAKKKAETIDAIEFKIPDRFNFEKVCKRTHLDIASVNTALQISTSGDRIDTAHLSAGGVGPVPNYMTGTCDALAGKPLSPGTVLDAARTMQKEVSPISDARGSAEYKSLLLRQLFFGHFIKLFPERFTLSDLV